MCVCVFACIALTSVYVCIYVYVSVGEREYIYICLHELDERAYMYASMGSKGSMHVNAFH